MSDYNSDQGRELRRARLTVVRPENAPDLIDEKRFNTEFKGRHIVVRELMTEVEETHHVMFCPACHENVDDYMVAVRKLHVMYAEDPLRNYRALVTLECKGCGWSEIVPVDNPPPLTGEEQEMLRESHQWRMKQRMEELRNVSFSDVAGLNAQAQRQVAKSAMLGAAYGMGQQSMKALISGQMGSYSGISIVEGKDLRGLKGKALADAIWADYDAVDKLRAEAASAKLYVEHQKFREQTIAEMAKEMTLQIDKEIMSELADRANTLTPVKGHGKGRVTAPPPPKLDKYDRAEMERQLKEAEIEAAGDPEKMRTLMQRIREFFW